MKENCCDLLSDKATFIKHKKEHIVNSLRDDRTNLCNPILTQSQVHGTPIKVKKQEKKMLYMS